MKVVANLNNLRIAPRKVRLVTHSIIGMPAEAALVTLSKQVKRSSLPIEVLLKSAIANATNNFNLDKATLVVREIQVGDGARLKRYMPKAFGQATQILRRSSKIRIVLEGEEAAKKQVVKPKKKETAKVSKESETKDAKAEKPKETEAKK